MLGRWLFGGGTRAGADERVRRPSRLHQTCRATSKFTGPQPRLQPKARLLTLPDRACATLASRASTPNAATPEARKLRASCHSAGLGSNSWGGTGRTPALGGWRQGSRSRNPEGTSTALWPRPGGKRRDAPALARWWGAGQKGPGPKAAGGGRRAAQAMELW